MSKGISRKDEIALMQQCMTKVVEGSFVNRVFFSSMWYWVIVRHSCHVP